jgi:putative toxin-antitoxin system antitoxin component (TIGR02293 family)
MASTHIVPSRKASNGTAHRDVGAAAGTKKKSGTQDTFAQTLARGIAEVVQTNMVDATGAAVHIFRMVGTSSRLDTQAAAFVAHHGLKVQAVEDWLQVANLPKQGFYGGLRLSPSTLSRKNKDDTLDAAVTERLVRQSELMVKAAEVFGDGAGRWMTKAHPLLEGCTPLDAASNEYGGVKVRQILNAIEHGGVV